MLPLFSVTFPNLESADFSRLLYPISLINNYSCYIEFVRVAKTKCSLPMMMMPRQEKSLAAQTSSPPGWVGGGYRFNCARGRVFNINHLTNYSNKLTDGAVAYQQACSLSEFIS